MSEREELMADALDHIARVAGGARIPTRRLDWIAARARRALAGKPFDALDLPKYPKMAIRSSGNEGQVKSSSI